MFIPQLFSVLLSNISIYGKLGTTERFAILVLLEFFFVSIYIVKPFIYMCFNTLLHEKLVEAYFPHVIRLKPLASDNPWITQV